MDELNHELTDESKAALGAARIVRPSDPDVFDNPESARVRARQIGCIGIRRYNNRNGGASWMPCTNESDYRRVSGFGPSGRRFRRQQLERDIREIVGARGGRKVMEKSANYTKPELRERLKQRIMAGSKGGRPGQWSARKAQLLALAYRKAGGGYKGGKTKKQRSLTRWTKQKWRTSDGKPAIRGSVTRRYLPSSAWAKLTPSQRAATNRKKIQGSKLGRQFVANTEAAQRARKRSVQGQKHLEFYEDFEFKAIGKKLGRALPGQLGQGGGSSRGGKRFARRIGGAMAAFDPNPIDADQDLVVQEGTVWERPAPPRVPGVSRPSVRPPQMPESEAFGRAARMADGRFRETAPEAARRTGLGATRGVRRGATTQERQRIVPQRQTERRAREISPFEAVPLARRAAARGYVAPDTYRDDTAQLIRSQRPEIYRSLTSGEESLQQLADRFDVVKDEITQAVRNHEKFRSSNMRQFDKRNPKLSTAIKNFANSRDLFMEGIKERKFNNWDSMVQYVFRSPDVRKNNKHIDMQNDLFKAFPSGANPDGKSNIILGYVPSRLGANRPPIKTFNDLRKPKPDFRSIDRVSRAPETTGTSSDIIERAQRRYRRDSLQIEAIRRGRSISGAMSTQMTPAEENNWKRKEWKRQQLKNLALEPDAATKYPTLSSRISNGQLIDGIMGLDSLTDDEVGSLWDSTVNEIAAIPGAKIPAYQARNAPLSPRELAAAATVKRPLAKAFLDEYKKFAPTGELAKIDLDTLDDKGIESFYNTFILPELVNNGAPTIQDVERAASTPESASRLTDAEQLLLMMPSDMRTLELRMKLANKALVDSGMSPDDPEFDNALQKMIQDQLDLEATQLADDVEKWLNGGFDKPKQTPINPLTGQPYTREEVDEQLDLVMQNIQALQQELDQEAMEELGYLGQVRNLLASAAGLEEFLTSTTRTAENAPVNPLTGRAYTAREWIESGGYKIHKMPNNPLTGKPYTVKELTEQMDLLDGQMTDIRNRLGLTRLSELNNQNELFYRLVAAAKTFDDGADEEIEDVEGDLLEPGQQPDEEPKTIEEMDQEIQDLLDNATQILDKKIDELYINPDDIAKAKQLRRRLDSLIGTFTLEDTDEVWNSLINPVTGQPYPPYDGSPSHPLNKTPDGTPLNINDPDFMLPDTVYREHLDPNNNELQEWLDIDNTHTVGRYTAPPRELLGRFYQGDINSNEPDKIDNRISWDRLIGYIQKTAPSLFKRSRKNELVGDINELTRNGRYGGASLSGAEFDPTIPSSGYQFEQQLSELRDVALAAERAKFLSPDATSVAERSKLWNLFETKGLTSDEIAFDEQIIDAEVVSAALLMHATDQNVPKTKFQSLKIAAQQAEPNRRSSYDNRRAQRLINEVRDLAALAGSSSQTGSQMIDEIDRAIRIQEERVQKIGLEYDQFRREDMALQKMITSMLQTRPKNRPIVKDSAGNVIQDGWDSQKEPLARYLNRIQRWDDEFLGSTNPATGERKIGIVTYLINHKKSRARVTGEAGGASATTFIRQVAENNVRELQRFRQEIVNLQGQARSTGISGFMRVGGPINRAETAARRGARKAAYGRFEFANPQILKRYDRDGFSVAKRMVGEASGFNKTFSTAVADAIRNNSQQLAGKSGFEYLGWREQGIIRALDNFQIGGKLVTPQRARARKAVGANLVRASRAKKMQGSARDVIGYHRSEPKLYNPRISGAMTADRRDRITALGGRDYLGPNGYLSTGVELMDDGRYYVVNRHGEVAEPVSYPSFRAAQEAAHMMNKRMYDLKRPIENPMNVAEWQAAGESIRQSGYRSTAVIRQNIVDVAPVMPNGDKNRYIFKVDKESKPRAADALILRRNPETNKFEALVIQRAFGPHRIDGEGTSALPGGMFDETDKDLFATALREALEETGLKESDLLSVENLGIIDSPDWDPRFAKGIEVGAVMVEVPPTWNPVAGDDATSARFVPLESLANGDIPLGFGHAAWFDAALSAHEDDELSRLGSKFALLNILSRQRQQKIIKEVNQQRMAWNEGRMETDLTLFDQEHPQLGLFPLNLPDTKNGWQTSGQDADARRAKRVGRIIAQMKAELESKNPKSKAFTKISGSMRASAREVGPDEFLSLPPAQQKQITGDIAKMRRAGLPKSDIVSNLTGMYAISGEMAFAEGTISPTDELVSRIVDELKDSGTVSGKVKDAYGKRKSSEAKDIAYLAKQGLTVEEISDFLDMSDAVVIRHMDALGFNPKRGKTVVGDRKSVKDKIANSLVNRSVYVDSTYGRMRIADIAEKYNMPESEVRASIDSYRDSVESLLPEHHRAYRSAMANGGESILKPEERDILKMRLDGLTSDEMSRIRGMSAGQIRTIEESGLTKLRATNQETFLGLANREKARQLRTMPVFEYLTNVPQARLISQDGADKLSPEMLKDAQTKFLRSLDAREFRSVGKDAYMLNQYMGTSIEELSRKYNMPDKEIREKIDSHAEAISITDSYRNRAVRRAIAANASESLSEMDIDFINMRNDGASLSDIARYFGSDENSMRAYQMSLMSKVNNTSGISGSMRSLPDIDKRDLYAELGVPEDAKYTDIDDAFRFIARQNMPRAMANDKYAMDELRRAGEAFFILSNPLAREKYDGGLMRPSGINADISDMWPQRQFIEPGTGRKRPTWVGDAISGESIASSNMFKLPHRLGSDDISDDIDDGILGFGINDINDDSAISDMVYRRPIPGTPDWDAKKREADNARRSGDPRTIFDENGFVIGKRLSYISKYDDPRSPDYIGDRFGGPKRGSSMVREMSISGKMAQLPPWDDSYEKSVNVGLPKAEPLPSSSTSSRAGGSTFSMFGQASKQEARYSMKSTFGGETEVKEKRFWSLYFPIAQALSKNVKRKRKAGKRKVFVSVGGAPGSGKTSMRAQGVGGIPDELSAVHVDADKIKLLIPEAKALHAAGNKNWGDMAHEESRLIADLSLRVAMDNDHDIVYDSTGQFNSGFDTLKAARAKGYDIVMHYVSAPESILEERVKQREKKDARALPTHIIPATVDRNYKIMPSVADAADEFYLWDSSGKDKVLVAQKERGKSLEILDPRAYLYGSFSDSGQKVTLETPMQRTPQRKVSKGSLAGKVITDRESGMTFADIAKKHKTQPETAFIMFHEAEIDPNMPEPQAPKFDKDGKPSFTQKPANKKSPGYVNDADAQNIFLSLPKNVQDDIWKMVAGQLDERTKNELNDYLDRNDIPVDVTVWAWENQAGEELFEDIEDTETARIWDLMSPSAKDAIATALEGGTDPLEISMILGTPLSVVDYAASLLYAFEEEDDDSISGRMSTRARRITRRAKSVNAKTVEQASLKKSPRWSQEELARAAEQNLSLGQPNPPDISGRMMPPQFANIDDELKPYFDDDNELGMPMFRHPLLYWLFPTNAEEINKAFKAKKSAVEDALKNKRWNNYVYMHERPYRVQAFMDIQDQLDDKEYWELLADIWIDSENNWQEAENWDELLSSDRPGKELMMNDDERTEFANLPQKITVYRGTAAGLNENGPSWTTSRERAEWFANRATRAKSKPKVQKRTVDKRDVVAYFTRRGESELLIPGLGERD